MEQSTDARCRLYHVEAREHISSYVQVTPWSLNPLRQAHQGKTHGINATGRSATGRQNTEVHEERDESGTKNLLVRALDARHIAQILPLNAPRQPDFRVFETLALGWRANSSLLRRHAILHQRKTHRGQLSRPTTVSHKSQREFHKTAVDISRSLPGSPAQTVNIDQIP